MTLDEAIQLYTQRAENHEYILHSGEFIGEEGEHMKQDIKCCVSENRQLAEWLTELKELRRLVDLVSKYAGKSEDICERYLPSIDGDLCVTDGMGASNCTCCGYEYRCNYKTDIGLLKDVETSTNADVQPVRFARWIDLDNRILCSGCGAGYDDSDEVKRNTYIFCPNCGARMDGDTE